MQFLANCKIFGAITRVCLHVIFIIMQMTIAKISCVCLQTENTLTSGKFVILCFCVHHVSLSLCLCIPLSPCLIVTMSHCHHVSLSQCLIVTKSHCHNIPLSSCHIVTKSHWHHVSLTPCLIVTMSSFAAEWIQTVCVEEGQCERWQTEWCRLPYGLQAPKVC